VVGKRILVMDDEPALRASLEHSVRPLRRRSSLRRQVK